MFVKATTTETKREKSLHAGYHGNYWTTEKSLRGSAVREKRGKSLSIHLKLYIENFFIFLVM